jgi:hypothetical protein
MTEAASAAAVRGREQRLLAWLAAVILVVLALYIDTHKVLWTDEAFSLDTSSGALSRSFSQALNFELQPPLYYLVLNLWLRLSRSIEFARLLSTVFVAAALPLLYHTGQVLRLSGWTISLPLLAALCPYVLWSASEARPYGLVVLLSAAVTYCYVRLLREPTGNVRSLATWYTVGWYLCILTFYYSGFLLLGQVVGAALVRRRLGIITLSGAMVGLLLVPWIPVVLTQMTVHPVTAPRAAIEGPTALEHGWATLRWAFGYSLESLFFAPALRRPWVLGVLAGGIGVIGVGYWRHRRSLIRDPMLLVFTTCALLPLAVLLAFKFLGVLELWPRYFAAVVVSVLTWMALVADRFPLARARLVLGGTMILFGALCVVSFRRISGGYEDWQSAARFVSAAEAAGDVIFVFEPDGVLSFRYYYRGQRPVFGLPVDRPTEEYSVERQAIHSVAQVGARIRAKVGPSGVFWVVARHQQPAFGRAFLDAFIDGQTTRLKESHPEGIDVGRFRYGKTTPVLRPGSRGQAPERTWSRSTAQ